MPTTTVVNISDVSSSFSLAGCITDNNTHIMALVYHEPNILGGGYASVANATRLGSTSRYTTCFDASHNGSNGTMYMSIYKVTKNTVVTRVTDYGTASVIIW